MQGRSELERLHEVDDRWVRLQSLRRLLTGQLAFLSVFLWLAALWPARLSHVEAVMRWLWIASAAITLIVIGFELAARWRFQRLIDVRGPEAR